MKKVIPGVVVKNVKTGKIGVPYIGHVYEHIGEGQVPIVYREDRIVRPSFTLTPIKDLVKHQLEGQDILTDNHFKKSCMPEDKVHCRYTLDGRDGPECAKIISSLNIAEEIDSQPKYDNMPCRCDGRYNPKALKRERSLLLLQ